MPKLKKTTVTTTTPVIEYDKQNLTWTVLEGILANSATVPAVFSEYKNSALINKGTIVSQTSYGVRFDAEKDLMIKNKDDTHIAGYYGVWVGSTTQQSDNASVYNDGSITSGYTWAVEAFNASNFLLNNTGLLEGFVYGVFLHQNVISLDKQSKIVNKGDIVGQGVYGVYSDLKGVKTVVENKSGAKIEGTAAAIYSTNQLKLNNDGKIKGDIWAYGPSTKDKVVNSGKITGNVDLLVGDDTYKSKDGKVDGMIKPAYGNDKIICGSKKEKIDLNSPPDETFNVDEIQNFESGKDMLFLFHFIFASFTGPGPLDPSEFHEGKTAQDADDYLLYHKKSGQLWYDADGNLPGDKIKIVDFDDGTKLKASDIEIYA